MSDLYEAREDIMIPKMLALDVETTLNGDEDQGKAHPMHPDNRIVALGINHYLGTAHTYWDTDKIKAALKHHGSDVVLVGHNLAFDLLYCYRLGDDIKRELQDKQIWDTQLAEYLLSGQVTKWSSLDELSVKYGLPTKDNAIKAYFQAGIGADGIPREELDPYLKGDVQNALAIAVKQYKEATRLKMLPLIKSQMEALHATIEMRFNGLHIDKVTADAYTCEVVDDWAKLHVQLTDLVKDHIEDLNSPKQWSTFFFGGTKKEKVKEQVGFYKNGNPKYQTVIKEIKITGQTDYKPDSDKIGAKGQVSVDEEVLTAVADYGYTTPLGVETAKVLLKYREITKQLNTYVTGLSKHFIYHPEMDKYFIHGNINHCATVTGRLSSTQPNLQNISNNPIKKIFTSRFDKGVVLEFDFNQLEVVALADITKDATLIKDISGGADIHSELYRDMYGRYPTKEERKPFKARTFQLIYGAGAKAISKQAKCSLEDAAHFVDTFYKRYPRVKDWHKEFADKVDAHAWHIPEPDSSKSGRRTYTTVTRTGRRFVFNEYKNDYTWSTRTYTFSPTELKNYPVQGFATGDIVPLMLGKIFRIIRNRDDVKVVNTVHDSIMFDCKAEAAATFIMEMLDVLRNTHKYVKETFGFDMALKLNAGASYGVNWFDMIEVKEEE